MLLTFLHCSMKLWCPTEVPRPITPCKCSDSSPTHALEPISSTLGDWLPPLFHTFLFLHWSWYPHTRSVLKKEMTRLFWTSAALPISLAMLDIVSHQLAPTYSRWSRTRRKKICICMPEESQHVTDLLSRWCPDIQRGMSFCMASSLDVCFQNTLSKLWIPT